MDSSCGGIPFTRNTAYIIWPTPPSLMTDLARVPCTLRT